MPKLVSIVVPVFNNELSLVQTASQIRSEFTKRIADLDYEIIFVDDGSTDSSYNRLLEISEGDDFIRLIKLTRNFGQMAAMLAGYDNARGDAIITVSADLQDPINLMPEMVNLWLSGTPIVVCHRVDREDPGLAKLLSALAYKVLRNEISQLPKGGFDFVLMDRVVLDALSSFNVRNRFFQGDLLWLGYNTAYLPYIRRSRVHGKSQYTFLKKLHNFADAFFDASFAPIHFITIIGILLSVLSFLYAISIWLNWLVGRSPFSGWSPIMLAVLFVGGVNMIMISIIGQYVWRINADIKQRPYYVVETTKG